MAAEKKYPTAKVEIGEGNNIVVYCNPHHKVIFTGSTDRPMFRILVDTAMMDHLLFYNMGCDLDVVHKNGGKVTVIPGPAFMENHAFPS